MTETVVPGAHASDGDLVRYVDGEGEPEERAALLAHVDACGECTARLARQRRRGERLTEMLRRSDYPVPAATVPARRPAAIQPWMRAAAMVALAVGVGTVWTTLRTGDALPERAPQPQASSAGTPPPAVADAIADSAAAKGLAVTDASGKPGVTPAPGETETQHTFMASGRAAMVKPHVEGSSGPVAAAAPADLAAGVGATGGAPTPVLAEAEELMVTAAPPPPPPPPPVAAPEPAQRNAASALPRAQYAGDTSMVYGMGRRYEPAEEKRGAESADRRVRGVRVPASRLVFAPAGDVLLVKVENAQEAGAVVLLAPQGTQGAAEVAGELGPDLAYERGLLRITNPAGATADYRIRLPGTIRRVMVTVGDGKPVQVETRTIDGAHRVELR